MDSVTQIALGAAVAETVMQNKVGRKASLWGAICGTLPDLDVLIPLGDPVSDFTYHRAASHSFFFMILATPLIVCLMKWFSNGINKVSRIENDVVLSVAKYIS